MERIYQRHAIPKSEFLAPVYSEEGVPLLMQLSTTSSGLGRMPPV